MANTIAFAAESNQQTIELESNSVEYDYSKGSAVYHGDVRIKQADMQLTGDIVEVFMEEQQVVRLISTGDLSELRDVIDGQDIYIEAKSIDYNKSSQKLTLHGKVKIDYLGKLLQAEHVIYDLNQQTINAPKQEGKRIKISIDTEKQQ